VRHQQALAMLLMWCWMLQQVQEMLLVLGMPRPWHCQQLQG
jgi:hypothetical protein